MGRHLQKWVGRVGAREALALALIVWFGFLYKSSLLPGVHHFGDTTKAQFLGKFLGITHPTGYPLYALLTAPFAWLPVGSLAERINAFSALCAVGALLLVYAIQLEQGVHWAFAGLASLVLGVSRVFWDQSVIAEVYALNALLFATSSIACCVGCDCVKRNGFSWPVPPTPFRSATT